MPSWTICNVLEYIFWIIECSALWQLHHGWQCYALCSRVNMCLVGFISVVICLFALIAGSNVSSPRPKLFQDVWHLVRGPRNEAGVLCVPELMGAHDAIHRHCSDGARRQQRTRTAAKDCSDTGQFLHCCNLDFKQWYYLQSLRTSHNVLCTIMPHIYLWHCELTTNCISNDFAHVNLLCFVNYFNSWLFFGC